MPGKAEGVHMNFHLLNMVTALFHLLMAAGLFSSSSVSAAVRLLLTLAPSQFCSSSQWTEGLPGGSSRNFFSATAVIRLAS